MNIGNLRVAIVHDYLNAWGGAEGVVSALHEIWPEAPIYTSLYDERLKEALPQLRDWKIIAPKWLQGKLFHRFPKYITFSLPYVFESFDFSGYDLVISSSAAFAKGVITGPATLHLNYCHTPPRFLYGYPGETNKRSKWYWRLILSPLDSYLRLWDYQAMQRPDYIVCNSLTVQERIRKFYRREAMVLYPPIEVGSREQRTDKQINGVAESLDSTNLSSVPPSSVLLPYFLVVARLSAFKNIAVIIRACGELKLPLKIGGTGREAGNLREIAKAYPGVELLGFVPPEKLDSLYAGATAVIAATSEEDFGMNLIEANAHGKPVLALRSGGHIEAVDEGVTGEFFAAPTVASLTQALTNFKAGNYSSTACYNWAERFSKERFLREFREFTEKTWQEFQAARGARVVASASEG